MTKLFFVSSLGDTDLAKASIDRMQKIGNKEEIMMVLLSRVAKERTEALVSHPLIRRIEISELFDKETVDEEVLKRVLEKLLEGKDVTRAFIGVPSSDSETPFQITSILSQNNVPCIIAYEYMFKSRNHPIWNYRDRGLFATPKVLMTIPLASAAKDFENITTSIVSHLSIDRAFSSAPQDAIKLIAQRKVLLEKESDSLFFVSGTTQLMDTDINFLEAILQEISTHKYPNLQIRFGLHPGRKDFNEYLRKLVEKCEAYPSAANQLKIILTPKIEGQLNTYNPPLHHSFILRCDISGSDAANIAVGVAQAVPGALLNEAAIHGKPVYSHEPVEPYLPEDWFAKNLPTFFTANLKPQHSYQDLGLEPDTKCDNKIAELMVSG